MKTFCAAVASAALLAACSGADRSAEARNPGAEAVRSDEAARAALDSAGERFVKLALALGQYDADFVDAYHGPAKWAEEAQNEKPSLEALREEAEALIAMLDEAGDGERARMLRKLTMAALTRIAMASGETFDFNTETLSLYDAVAPQYDLSDFDAALAGIDALLPGDGPLNERVDAFKTSLSISPEHRGAVFDAAIAECRRRTLAHYDLPESEAFRLEFVNDKPWSGYNWYQGDFESLIQINTDLPIYIGRAVDLGCHEGYPGHHTWNVMLERELLRKNGWIEYSVYPLFSPLSLIAEGSANYGIELAFPGSEKETFERDVLFPLAGLDPAQAEVMNRLARLERRLSHAQNHVAREYLDGRISKEESVELLMKYDLSSRARAEQRVRFIETYRGYVINYNLGRDLVRAAVESAPEEERWDAFGRILTHPVSASDLAPQP